MSPPVDVRPDKQSQAVKPPPRGRRLAARCSGCGMSFDTHQGRIELPHALAFHLEHAPDCVEVYCQEAGNLVDLEAGKPAIRQTLYAFKEAGRWAVIGIAPDGRRWIFYWARSASAARAWLQERLDGGVGPGD